MEFFVKNIAISALLIGFLLDSVLGDPRWLPHPIRWFGKIISHCENKWNTGKNKIFKGAIVSIGLINLVWFLLFIVFHYLKPYPYVTFVFSSIGVFYGLANHSLIKEAWKVEMVLRNEGINAARSQLSFIVGRNTENLNENQIRTAVLETLAENLSDGVIAPLFYYALGGVPLMLAYKMANTLDSMVGYKSDRYKDFGCFPARFDDVVNYIPARITALIMGIISFRPQAFKFIFKFGHKHASPNSGYPEAALAGILDTQFGGPNYYHGLLVEKPFIGHNARNISHFDIIKAAIINQMTTMVVIAIISFIFVL